MNKYIRIRKKKRRLLMYASGAGVAGGLVVLLILWGILGWISLVVAVTVGAMNRGRSGFGWCVLALLTSPVIAALSLFLVGKAPERNYKNE
jgi:hypothetical protein